MKCRLDGPDCSGAVFNSLGRLQTCRYHGELVVQLKNLTLPELEAIHSILPRNYLGMLDSKKFEKLVGRARKVALCSTKQEFRKHIKSVYESTYDYISH